MRIVRSGLDQVLIWDPFIKGLSFRVHAHACGGGASRPAARHSVRSRCIAASSALRLPTVQRLASSSREQDGHGRGTLRSESQAITEMLRVHFVPFTLRDTPAPAERACEARGRVDTRALSLFLGITVEWERFPACGADSNATQNARTRSRDREKGGTAAGGNMSAEEKRKTMTVLHTTLVRCACA
jgi:hypothetical protein